MLRRPSYSCRQFRRVHVEYVDGFLVGEARLACDAHLDECPVCRRQDVQVRRSLLALQSLRAIEPSADFHRRLRERLAHDVVPLSPNVRHSVRWGVAAVILVASVALLVATPSRSIGSRSVVLRVPAPMLLGASSHRDSVGQQVALVSPLIMPSAPQQQARPLKGTASARNRAARFEALPGQALLRTESLAGRPQSVRLQAVTYIGQ